MALAALVLFYDRTLRKSGVDSKTSAEKDNVDSEETNLQGPSRHVEIDFHTSSTISDPHQNSSSNPQNTEMNNTLSDNATVGSQSGTGVMDQTSQIARSAQLATKEILPVNDLMQFLNARFDKIDEYNKSTNARINARFDKIDENNDEMKEEINRIEQICNSRFESLKKDVANAVKDRETLKREILEDVDNKITNSEQTVREEFNPVLESLASRVDNIEKNDLTNITKRVDSTNVQLCCITKRVEEIASTVTHLFEHREKQSDITEYLKLDRLASGHLTFQKQQTVDTRQVSEREEQTEERSENRHRDNLQNIETPEDSLIQHLVRNQISVPRGERNQVPNENSESRHHRIREHSRTRSQEHFDYKHFLTVRKFKIFRNAPNDLHPCEWLQQFEHCLPPNWPIENKLEFMCGFLENEPASRMRIHISPHTSENEFRRIFLAAYWSETTQDRVKNSIRMLKSFVRSNFKSPAEYFQHMVQKNLFLTFPYNPSELISICLDKLPSRLRQLTIAARCKDDIEAFKELLEDLEGEQDEDLQSNRDSSRRSRNRSPYRSSRRQRHSKEREYRRSPELIRESPDRDSERDNEYRDDNHKSFRRDSDREYSDEHSYNRGYNRNGNPGRRRRYYNDYYRDNRRDNNYEDRNWRRWNSKDYDSRNEHSERSKVKHTDYRRDISGDRKDTHHSRQQSPDRKAKLTEVGSSEVRQNTVGSNTSHS